MCGNRKLGHLGVGVVVGFALVGATFASDSTASETSGEAEAAERRVLQEPVEVRVVLDEETSAPLGASTTVLDPAQDPGTPSSLTALVTNVPGVSENGQGGLFQVFSIRGVSRQRVSSLVSGMRITSERRAGVSTSFIDPALMGAVEVLRGPSTTFYGSGALGGVVQVVPREFSGWSVESGYESEGDHNHQVFGVGGDGWSLGLARRSAVDAEAADGTRLHSRFTQYSAVFRTVWDGGSNRYELLAIPTLAEDIGKANADFPERRTDYPLERHQLLKFSAASARGWNLEAFVHAQDLETEVVEDDDRSNVFNDSFDFGLRWEGRRESGERTTVRYGVDGFGRRDVDAKEGTERTLDGAEETELGAYGSVRWSWDRTRTELGGRFSWIGQDNGGNPDEDRSAWNGFAGVTRRFGERIELGGSLSSGLRFPSLSEQFFSGTTGGGEVLANSGLDPERSFNTELSVTWIGRSIVVDTKLFHNRIEDYIEREEVDPVLFPDLLTFANVTSGTIRGIEVQGVARPTEVWSLTWGGHAVDGEDSSNEPLADTPPDEAYLGAVYDVGGWRAEARLALRNERSDAAIESREQPIGSAELLGLSVRYRWRNGWTVGLSAQNLLDERYFASADRKAVPATGRSFAVVVSRHGG